MFSHNTGFRFRGGNFYSVTGDININPLAVTGDTPPHWGDREETEDTPNLQLDDPESQNDPIGGEYRRSDRQARRYMPYEASSRPRVQEIHITAPNVNHGIREGLDTLHRHAALEAMYNSAESFPQPRCHPETRIELLDDLSCRLNDPGVRVLWLYGPAGAGKSAIMQTLCQRLEKSEQLGGSYFFKRDHITRGHGRALFATLAYQLAIFDPTFKAAISKTVERNPSLVSTSIPSQLQQLIVQPCLTVPDDAPRILLIDGLDECEGIAVQQEILRSIHDIFCADALPLKILIASRPEPDIREMFDTWSFPGLYAVNVEQSLTDVEIYLRREFTRIHWEHRTTMSNVAAPWPSQDILGTLARKSSGYFVYAATVIKFVDDKQFRPTEQLDIILDPSSDSGDSPYSNLDTLYIQILRQVPTRLRPRLLAILSVVIAGWEFSPRDIEQSLGLKDGDVLLTLRKLHSLLSISGDLEPLKTRHASFGDFLLTNSRSSEFHITEQHRLDLARWAVKTLSSPQLPEKTHCTWQVAEHWVDYIALQIRPSTELLPLIRVVNLDFFFLQHATTSEIQSRKLLSWLKMAQTPQLDDNLQKLIGFWERVNWVTNWMHHAPFLLRDFRSPQERRARWRQLFQEVPHLRRIVGVLSYKIISSPYPLFQARLLLDLSWVDIIQSLLLGADVDVPWVDYMPPFLSSVERSKDIVLGLFRVLRRIRTGDLSRMVWKELRYSDGKLWAQVFLDCPRSDAQILEELSTFPPPSVSLYSPNEIVLAPQSFSCIVKWLKACPDVSPDLINRWEGYQDESWQIFRDQAQRGLWNYDRKWNIVVV